MTETTVFVVGENGNLIFTCASVGMPIPAGTQLTNPQQVVDTARGPAVIDQAEPNGLHPVASRGTVFFCLNEDGTVSPQYFEKDVNCVTIPSVWDENLKRIVPIPGKQPSMKFDRLPKVTDYNPAPSATATPS